jgi:predicted amidophosphoribosyltransferase
MDDFDWFESGSGERFHSAIYNCPDCNKKVAFGDNFCRHCGVKYTPAMCRAMKKNLKVFGSKNFKHLVIAMILVLLIILTTTFA